MERFLIAVVALCFVAGVSFGAMEAGNREVQVSGSLQKTDADWYETTTLSGQLNYNYFLSDNVSVGGTVRLSLSKDDSDNDGDETSKQLFFLGRGDYYLAGINPDTVPYVGGHLGIINYEYGDDSETVLTYGIHGGLKFFVSERVSWNTELDYTTYTVDTDMDDSDVKVISLLLGMSYYF